MDPKEKQGMFEVLCAIAIAATSVLAVVLYYFGMY